MTLLVVVTQSLLLGRWYSVGVAATGAGAPAVCASATPTQQAADNNVNKGCMVAPIRDTHLVETLPALSVSDLDDMLSGTRYSFYQWAVGAGRDLPNRTD